MFDFTSLLNDKDLGKFLFDKKLYLFRSNWDKIKSCIENLNIKSNYSINFDALKSSFELFQSHALNIRSYNWLPSNIPLEPYLNDIHDDKELESLIIDKNLAMHDIIDIYSKYNKSRLLTTVAYNYIAGKTTDVYGAAVDNDNNNNNNNNQN